MPVFKIKKDGNWQEVAGVSGHTHSVSQIVDFPPKELPIVTDSDNGKFLRVVAGQWSAQAIPNAEEVSF